MSIYAIGDLQGCIDELHDLLEEIQFDENNDQLWFCGDLVNRGPKSLQCLRFVKSLKQAKTVLGNHDLHLLAVANGTRKAHKSDTFDDILSARDKNELLIWLRQQPLMLKNKESGFYLIHAGLPPQWTIEQAFEQSRKTSALIKSERFDDFLDVMYGNTPELWNDELKDFDKHRFVINSLTRLRYCTKKGALTFSDKGPPGSQSNDTLPWYSHPKRKSKEHKILFGHWSTIHLGEDKNFQQWNVYPLDTGCLWGGRLTALRLEDETWFSVPSRQKKFAK